MSFLIFICNRFKNLPICRSEKHTTGSDNVCPELDDSTDEILTRVMIGRMLSFVGKMCISGSFALVYLIMTEVFPTEATSTCMGIITMFSGVGAMITPFLVQVLIFEF